MRKIRLKVKNSNQEEAIKNIEETLGVTLVAKRADSTVNGHVNFINDGRVAEVVLYEEDEEPTFQMYEKDGQIYATGRKTTIKKAAKAINKLKQAERRGVI